MDHSKQQNASITQAQAEEAVRTLLRWAGEDPTREGLLDTHAVSLKHTEIGSAVTAKILMTTCNALSRKSLATTR